MRHLAAVKHGVLRHHHAEIVGKPVDNGSAHAATGAAAGDNEGVGTGIDQIARERRAEERAWVLFRHQNIIVARRDLGDEFIAFRSYAHDGGHLVGEAAGVEILFWRDVGVEHRPAICPEHFQEPGDVADSIPGDFAARRRKFLDRLPEWQPLWCQPCGTARR